MRYLFVGLLLAGFPSMQAVAENETSADLVSERLCADARYQDGSNGLDRCVRNARKNGAVHENGNASATQDKNAQQTGGNAPGAAVGSNGSDETFCENYGYVKGTDDYEQCLALAAENGYGGDASKMQNGAQNSARKKKRRLE